MARCTRKQWSAVVMVFVEDECDNSDDCGSFEQTRIKKEKDRKRLCVRIGGEVDGKTEYL